MHEIFKLEKYFYIFMRDTLSASKLHFNQFIGSKTTSQLMPKLHPVKAIGLKTTSCIFNGLQNYIPTN